MFHFFLECTIRAALIVGATALVLYAMRVKVASVKHRVWTAVLLLMLALPLWIAWGPKAPIRILPANVENFAADVLVQTPPPSKAPLQKTDTSQATPAPVQSLLSPLEWSFLGLYLFGALIFLARLAIGTSKARRLVRESSPFGFPVGDEVFALASGMLAVNKEKSRHADTHLVSTRHAEQRPYLTALRRTSLAFLSRGAERAIAASNRPHRIRISAACAAPVTVGCFHPTILLPENWREWSASQLAAVLAHEREHARRCDPLAQWLALFNRAIFWFHPAAWWLERELSALAEESCDAAVLAQGHDPAAYAETLMHMARAVIHSGARINATGTAMPGPRLPQRIRKIIDAPSSKYVSHVRLTCIVAACTSICVALLAVTLTRAQSSDMLAWEKAAGGKVSFEVASIKQDKNEPTEANFGGNMPLDAGNAFSPTGGLFSASNQWFVQYMIFAYKLTQYQYRAIQKQLPDWANNTRYDIEARATGNPTKDQYRMMMQSLLEERFKLAVHFQTVQAPVFALIMDRTGKLGPQLRTHEANRKCGTGDSAGAKAGPGGFPLRCGIFLPMKASVPGRVRYGASDANMAFVADWLMRGTGTDKPVIDETGLGQVDFVIEYSPDAPPNPKFTPDTNGPTFIEALKDQLGLKLISTTAPVSEIVIDHIQEPTPN